MEPDPTIRQTGEDALVARLLPLMPSNAFLVTGPGDDCAVARSSGNRQLLLKTDCVVEGMHFLPGTDPELIGRKALARAVSDIAAMGGHTASRAGDPVRACGPPRLPGGRNLPGNGTAGTAIRHQHCRRGKLRPAGRRPHHQRGPHRRGCGRERPVLRSTARAGDLLAVTGVLGGSFPTGHHLSFIPRVREGGVLAASGLATAMMDLSDGLGTDLPRLAAASGLGFRIHAELLPVRPGFTAAQAAGDGEDYELLGHVPSRRPGAGCPAGRGAFPGNALHRYRGNDDGTLLRPSVRLQAFQLAG